MLFLTLACLLAAIGVVSDSTVTVVGAMVLGPEFGPLAAMSVALVQRRWDLARRAAHRADWSVSRWRWAITALATKAVATAGWLTWTRSQHVSEVDFIFQVGPLSFAVALLAGAAGMLSLVSSKSAATRRRVHLGHDGARRGFAVVAAILGDWAVAAKSAAQLAVNLVGIVIAGVLVLVLRPRGPILGRRDSAARREANADGDLHRDDGDARSYV